MSAAFEIVEPPLTVEAIFREHAPYVWRVLRRMGVQEHDAEDVCQEVFVVVHRRLPDFDGLCAVRTWLYGICVRVASDYRKRPHHRRERLAFDDLPEVGEPANQEEALEKQRARDRLDRALCALDEAKRAVFVLYEIEGLSMNEVVAALGCPLQTGYSRLHAARKTVIACLEEADSEGEPATRSAR